MMTYRGALVEVGVWHRTALDLQGSSSNKNARIYSRYADYRSAEEYKASERTQNLRKWYRSVRSTQWRNVALLGSPP